MTAKQLRALILQQIDTHQGYGEWSEDADIDMIHAALGEDDQGDLVRHAVVKEYREAIRQRSPENNGQTVLFEAGAVLQLGGGQRILMADVGADALDRANAVRSRNYADQARAAAAWATFYAENAPVLRDTGATLGEIYNSGAKAETA